LTNFWIGTYIVQLQKTHTYKSLFFLQWSKYT